MPELLRCVDRWYREIVLFEDTWYDKIVVDHEMMVPYLDILEGALRNPDYVTSDAHFQQGQNFYRAGFFQHPYRDYMVKVCVRYSTDDTGREYGVIVTAYPAMKLKRGERMRWQR